MNDYDYNCDPEGHDEDNWYLDAELIPEDEDTPRELYELIPHWSEDPRRDW